MTTKRCPTVIAQWSVLGSTIQSGSRVGNLRTKTMPQKIFDWFLMGLFFGMGFAIAGAVLQFIASLIARAN